MFGVHRARFAALATAFAALLAGCGGGGSSAPALPQSAPDAAIRAAAGSAPLASDVAAFGISPEAFAAARGDAPDTGEDTDQPDAGALDAFESAPASVAGTYDGTLTETASGNTVKGTVVISVIQSGSKVHGDFVFTYKGFTSTVTYTGTGHHTAHGFAMKLLLVDSKGCTATGPATVAKKKLSGSYKSPACKGGGASVGKYSAVKKSA